MPEGRTVFSLSCTVVCTVRRSSDLRIQRFLSASASSLLRFAPNDSLSRLRKQALRLQHLGSNPPCSGFSPDSLVQQNKNACPLISLWVAHLPQNKPELYDHTVGVRWCSRASMPPLVQEGGTLEVLPSKIAVKTACITHRRKGDVHRCCNHCIIVFSSLPAGAFFGSTRSSAPLSASCKSPFAAPSLP